MNLRKLDEEAVDTKKARSLGLALFIGGNDPKTYMLYDAKGLVKAKEAVESDVENDYLDCRDPRVLEHVRAVLMPGAAALRSGGWGSKEVKAAAAEHRYGPLLYDIVMGLEGGLMADRDSVSGQAKKVWNYYKANRPDVVAKPLDDFMNPRTPTKKDDVTSLHPGGMKNSLNYAYFIKHVPSVGTLVNNHKAAKKKLKWDNDMFNSIAQSFFDEKYF